MDHLYVCHFSNGHIKVGRSIDPVGRIAQHADRVSCMGVELVEHHTVKCVGHVVHAEANLIAACAELSTGKNSNEWFQGVDYLEACDLADKFSSDIQNTEQTNGWREYTKQVLESGFTQRGLAKCIGCAQPSIANIVCGRTTDPSFQVGYGLLMIGRSVGLKDPAFISKFGCAA